MVHFFARSISGLDPLGLRLLDILFVLILWMSTSAILATWKINWPERLTAFSSYIVYYFSTGFGQTAQRESFALPLVVLGIIPLLVPETKKRNSYYWILFGAIAGLGLWIKPTPALIVIFAIALALRRSENIRIKLLEIFAYIAGIALVSILAIDLLWTTGALEGFIEWGIIYVYEAYQTARFSWPVRFADTMKTLSLSEAPLPLYLSGAGILLHVVLRKKIRMPLVYLSGGLIMAALLGALLQGKTHCTYHFIPFKWALGVLAAVLISGINPDRLFARFRILIPILLVTILAMAGNGFSHQEPFLTSGTTFGRELGKVLPSSETIVLFGFSPTLLSGLERRTPFPFIDSWVMYCCSYDNERFRKTIIASLRESVMSSSVKYLIIEKNRHLQLRGFSKSPDTIIEEEIGIDWINAQGFFRSSTYHYPTFDVYERRRAE